MRTFSAEKECSSLSRFRYVLYAVTGVLFLRSVFYWFIGFALAYKHHAELSFEQSGLKVFEKRFLLGKELSTKETLVLYSALRSASRETVFEGLGLRLGLMAFLLGTTLGVHLVYTGAQAGSFSLFFWGPLVFVLGIVMDFFLEKKSLLKKEKVRLTFVTIKGEELSFGKLSLPLADLALRELESVLETQSGNRPAHLFQNTVPMV